jgi:hopene-associated glycosyltransferase HpnB
VNGFAGAMALVAALPLLIWIYLLCGRGGFWRASRQCAASAATETAPRRVVAVIPARNEATLIGSAVASLLCQQHAGELSLIVIDDGSSDGTAAAAEASARNVGASQRLQVLRAPPPPHGWTGKLWAQAVGVRAAAVRSPDYLWLTDADIVHGPGALVSLVALADSERRDLVSYMVKLAVSSRAERWLIPAFVFFFFMLYPPAWVANPRRRSAAAAGGCVLIRPQALERIGGLDAIRSHIIDDCALAGAVKRSGGSIRLALTHDSYSLRAYGSSAEIGTMIARTAFAQLRHSYVLLALTILGLCVTYLLPLALLASGVVRFELLGAAAWLLMSLCYLPMVRFYGVPLPWCLTLPAVALFYFAATCNSALRFARGRGGSWKGRTQDV